MKKETWIDHQTRLKEKYSDYDAESNTITSSELIKKLSKSNPESKVLIEVRDGSGDYHYYPIKSIIPFYGDKEDSICISGGHI